MNKRGFTLKSTGWQYALPKLGFTKNIETEIPTKQRNAEVYPHEIWFKRTFLYQRRLASIRFLGEDRCSLAYCDCWQAFAQSPMALSPKTRQVIISHWNSTQPNRMFCAQTSAGWNNAPNTECCLIGITLSINSRYAFYRLPRSVIFLYYTSKPMWSDKKSTWQILNASRSKHLRSHWTFHRFQYRDKRWSLHDDFLKKKKKKRTWSNLVSSHKTLYLLQ